MAHAAYIAMACTVMAGQVADEIKTKHYPLLPVPVGEMPEPLHDAAGDLEPPLPTPAEPRADGETAAAEHVQVKPWTLDS